MLSTFILFGIAILVPFIAYQLAGLITPRPSYFKRIKVNDELGRQRQHNKELKHQLNRLQHEISQTTDEERLESLRNEVTLVQEEYNRAVDYNQQYRDELLLDYTRARKRYELTIIPVAIIFGTLAIALAWAPFIPSQFHESLLMGGLLCFVMAATALWNRIGDMAKLILLIVWLVILVLFIKRLC